MKRAHTEAGVDKRVRLPIALNILLGEGSRVHKDWGPGGRILYLCLLLSHFKSDAGIIHPVHCLTRADIALFSGPKQLRRGEWKQATRAEIRFRGHKGDQDQVGSVLVRTREMAFGPRSRLESDGGAVAVLVELLSCDDNLSEHVPLAAFKCGSTIKVWDYRQATRALRQIAGQAGLDPKRVSLHNPPPPPFLFLTKFSANI
ncbi:unnamed protein product [Laminaria digitata]